MRKSGGGVILWVMGGLRDNPFEAGRRYRVRKTFQAPKADFKEGEELMYNSSEWYRFEALTSYLFMEPGPAGCLRAWDLPDDADVETWKDFFEPLAVTYAVMVSEHSRFPDDDPPMVFDGFTTAELAAEFARRWTRDSLEEFRLSGKTPQQVREDWGHWGESARVLGGYNASDDIQTFLDHPATWEERDWGAVKKQAGLSKRSARRGAAGSLGSDSGRS